MFSFKDTFTSSMSINRLIDDYKKHKNIIVAFDFDNTIYDYHHKGYCFDSVIELLRKCSDIGFTMVLFTANENESKLKFCKQYCSANGIRIDFINESPIMNTRKPYYNILLDDRAGLAESYYILSTFLHRLKLCKQ